MPNLDGHQAVRRIREVERQSDVGSSVPPSVILMVTSLDIPRHRAEALFKDGCNGYLVKSTLPNSLPEAMRDHGITPMDKKD